MKSGSGQWQRIKPTRNDGERTNAALDETDQELLELSDGTISIQTMMLVLGLSEVGILRRLRRLFATGLLDGIASIAGQAARAARAANGFE
jgi:DNA-binding Lrp family transcriptional regulator